MDKAIIIGAGTYGQVYAAYIADFSKYSIIGFLDDDVQKIGTVVNGIKVLGAVKTLNELSLEMPCAVFVPIGENIVREKILNLARSLGYHTPSYIHPSCQIHSSVIVGESVYILPSSNIMPHTIIEDNVMISMGVNVAHHTRLGRCSFYSQGANIGASVNIDSYAFVGIGSTIMTGVRSVGRNAIIGAGAVIIRDVYENTVIVGNPGRVLK